MVKVFLLMNCATFAEMAVLIRNYFYCKKKRGVKKEEKKKEKRTIVENSEVSK